MGARLVGASPSAGEVAAIAVALPWTETPVTDLAREVSRRYRMPYSMALAAVFRAMDAGVIDCVTRTTEARRWRDVRFRSRWIRIHPDGGRARRAAAVVGDA